MTPTFLENAPPLYRARVAFVAVVLLLGAAGIIAPTSAEATTVIKMNVEKLSVRSDAIVLGQVESFESHWEGNRIVTDVRLRVVVPVKGEHDAETVITVKRLGGTVGDLRQVTPGATDFAKGEKLLVFLDKVESEQSGATKLVVMGMSQGKYALAEGKDGKLYGVRDLSKLSLAEVEERADGSHRVLRIEEGAAVNEGAEPLEMLLYRVGKALETNAVAVRPELKTRIGASMSDAWDFRIDFDKAEVKP